MFRGGLDPKTLQTLIETNDDVEDETEEPRLAQTAAWGNLFQRPSGVAVTITKPPTEHPTPDPLEPNAGTTGFLSRPHTDYNRSSSFGATDSYNLIPEDDDDDEDDDGTGKKARNKWPTRHRCCC